MIAYYGPRGNRLGQAVIVPSDAPIVPLAPVVPVVAPGSVVVESPVYEQKVTLTKAGLIVGGLVLAALALTLSSAFLRRS